ARIVLAVEAVSISLMLVIFGVLLAGPPAPPAPTGAAPGWSLVGVAAGVLPALGAFIGFEAATTLGVEARRPFVSVPRAVLGTAGLVGLLSLLAAYTQVVGFAGALGGQPEPVVSLAAAHGTPWLAGLLFLRRIGELTPAPVVVTALVVPVLAVVCAAFVGSALDGAVPIVLGALVLAALAWYAVLRARRPRELAGIGVYDEPSAADV